MAYGWALEDRQGFCKVLVERGSGPLIGAHLLGAQAPGSVQPLVVAMTFGLTAQELADRRSSNASPPPGAGAWGWGRHESP
ncbi:hypothetical protein ACFYW9_28155 [Streptomyces sp. NPDC002698]|uniref:hypothetical protein n=1 Tax=Streptomyces sp. NPDC002698 TaxID=3364660 RepID=UPI0036AF8B2D